MLHSHCSTQSVNYQIISIFIFVFGNFTVFSLNSYYNTLWGNSFLLDGETLYYIGVSVVFYDNFPIMVSYFFFFRDFDRKAAEQ